MSLQVSTTSALAVLTSGFFAAPEPFGARVVAGPFNGVRGLQKGLVRLTHECSLHARYVEQRVEHVERVEDSMEQIPLRILQEVGEPVFLPEYIVSRMQDEADAVAYCWANRRIKGMGVTEAARYLGMPKSHLSNILNGKKYPPYGKRIEMQRLFGNWGIRQWEDRQCGFITKPETPEQREIRRLTQENESLRMKVAA